jgi:Bacterial pullanase-associated domain
MLVELKKTMPEESMSRISHFRMSPLRLVSLVAALALMGGLSLLSPLKNAHAATTLTVTIHYFRADGNYLSGKSPTWDIWSWNDNGDGGNSHEWTGTDSFGEYTTYTQSCNACTQIGLIVRVSDWSNREAPGNRFIPVVSGTTSYSAWVVSGDQNTYFSLAAANASKYLNVKTAVLHKSKLKTVIVTTTKNTQLLATGTPNQCVSAPVVGCFKVVDQKTHKSYRATSMLDAHKYSHIWATAVGDWQAYDGNPADSGGWNPASTTTRLKKVNRDLYAYTVNLPASPAGKPYQYKITTNGNFNNAYPSSNVSLELDGQETVTFYYVPYQNGVYDSINNPTQALPPDGVGFETDLFTLTFKKALNAKDHYKLYGPGLQTPGIVKVVK